ncbi:MAG: Clp protease N-terminal domain-containing protein, partial [Pirellulaceae bacterium]|nr:Clp protease N-terminal domain-containing protein [Pirellulaceae bacterium]
MATPSTLAFESAATVARKDDTTFNTLHLLAALMRDGSLPEIAEVAEGKKISMTDLINRCDDAARAAERWFNATGDRGTGASQTTSAEQWKELFDATELKAKEWKHDYLGPAHLLLAFIADDPLTKLFLKDHGIEAAEI